jgi:hypothetical protein
MITSVPTAPSVTRKTSNKSDASQQIFRGILSRYKNANFMILAYRVPRNYETDMKCSSRNHQELRHQFR